MATATKKIVYSFDDFYFLIREDQKADLIDGVIYMASPENINAFDLFGWLYYLIRSFMNAAKPGGHLLGSRVAFRLDGKNGPEPDLGYVTDGRCHLIRKTYVDGPPDMAIEIVSPESVERDYEDKRAQYEAARVPEYWIVDPLSEKLTLLRLDGKGKYHEVRPKKGVYASEVLSGFWLRAEWLWKRPLPNEAEVLQEILAESR